MIGAGIAGLACAHAAASAGASVDLFEAQAQLPARPVHLLAPPNMVRALAALGLADEAFRAGFAFHGIDVVDSRGIGVATLDTPSLAGHRFPAAMGLTHAGLAQGLSSAALALGVRVHFQRPVQVQRTAAGLAWGVDRGDWTAPDLVVLATGALSPLRRAVFSEAVPVTALAQAWLYGLVRRPLDLHRPRFVIGPQRRKSWLVPVGAQQAGLAYVHAGPLPASPSEQRELMVRALQAFPALERHAAQELGLPVVRPVHRGMLHAPDTDPVRSTSEPAVLAVGECACALPPHFGQRTPQAIEDAVVLRELLLQAPPLQALPGLFHARRFARRRDVHEIASVAANWDVMPDKDTDFVQLHQRLTRLLATPP